MQNHASVAFSQPALVAPTTSTISSDEMTRVVNSLKWKRFAASINTRVAQITSIKLSQVKWFGPKPGFIIGEADGTLAANPSKGVSGFFVVRGPAVALLIIVNTAKWVVVQQHRLPVGDVIDEVVAGMLDESGEPTGVAVAEAEEETGTRIRAADMVSLGSFYTSPGLLDEVVHCYAVHITMSSERIAQMESGTHGEAGSNEVIKARLLPLTAEAVCATRDCKAIACYTMLNALNALPPSQREFSGSLV